MVDFSDIFPSLNTSGAEKIIFRLEDQLEAEQRIKKAYVSALVDACGGAKAQAKKLVKKYLAKRKK